MAECVGILLVFLIAVALLIYIRDLKRLEKDNLRRQENIHQSEAFFEEVQGHIDDIRKYRHDLKKHIRIVEEFLREGEQYEHYSEYRELTDHIMHMQKDMEEQQKLRFCDNELLNAICEIKSKECADAGISYSSRIFCPDLSWIDDFYLTGILMNLLDNAVEAQERLASEEDKYIILSVTEDSDSVEIIVENRISDAEAPDFHTQKTDKENHGLGLEIAKQYTAFYDGELAFQVNAYSHFLRISTVLHRSHSGQDSPSLCCFL